MHASLACAEAEVTLGSFSPWSLGSAIATWGTTRETRKEERKWRETAANKQNKLGKALCWAGAGTGVGVCVCVRRSEQSGGD